jgi:DNA polymerase-1
MRHIIFDETYEGPYQIALLIKSGAFVKPDLVKNYITPLQDMGLETSNVIAFTLDYNEDGKAPAGYIKSYLNKLLQALDSIGTTTLYVADANYFKVLVGKTKADPYMGYVMPCAIKGYEHMSVILGVNYSALIYNPDLKQKLELGLQVIADVGSNSYIEPGTTIIHSGDYPNTLEGIADALNQLHQYPSLACDIETFSLRFNEAGIGSIAFAWDEHNGIAFAVDYCENPIQVEGNWGYQLSNKPVHQLLKQFFEEYPGEVTYHNATYDVKILIYELWMKDALDTEGLLTGLEIMTRNVHDTKIIAYLATNSTAGNHLGLKHLAHEFAGNWAVDDIKDIRRIPLNPLLQYNLVDTLSTQYVRKKYEPIMIQDNQQDLYAGLMLSSLKVIIQIELSGMPMSRTQVAKAKGKLISIQQECLNTILTNPNVVQLNESLQKKAMESANAKLKTKQHPIEKFSNIIFNPNSNPNLQDLLYEHLGLPVIDFTDAKQPATGTGTIEKLVHHATTDDQRELLESLISYSKVTKILAAFIPSFEKAISKDASDIVWLHGSFNIGGTVSGRLSSSSPNLQQIPANSTYGKTIKECFVSPPGWVMAGADFNSLEDYISALTTKDSNKLSVYLSGFDGHCLRAAYYFKDHLSDINLEDPASVNSIKKSHPELRQESKGPTFALTYQGTWHTLVNNLGFDPDVAKSIEANYHELYKESDEYIQKRLEQAAKDGYVDVAFGLRVRTPLLGQTVYGGPKMPYEAAAEGRTAGNAMGQSYGLLNNRAVCEFMEKVWNSPYRLKVLPIALIHDAIYLLIKDELEVVTWVNQELIKCMQWQELPEIQHDSVKLGAELDVYYQGWHQAITLPNNASAQLIKETAQKGKTSFVK